VASSELGSLVHRTVRCARPRLPLGCPVNYSGVPPRIPKGGKFGVGFPGAPDSPVRQTRAAFGLSFALFYLNPFSDFLLVCVEPLAPVELII
jgi:hypothetical protein